MIYYHKLHALLLRDSLRTDIRRIGQSATVIEKTTIEDQRRKLEGRINIFHRKADGIMGGAALDDVVLTPGPEEALHQWDDVEKWAETDQGSVEGEKDDESVGGGRSDDDSSSNNDKMVDRDLDDDDEENLAEYPERLSVLMPSSLGRDFIEEHGLETLASQEIRLRVGQANDALADLRLELGHKSLLFRTKVRNSKNTKGKTRAWRDVARSSMEVMKHVRRYQRARRALTELGADQEILLKYKDIRREDLKMSADILEENRVGQRNTTLVWFWQLGPQEDTDRNEWMEECQ